MRRIFWSRRFDQLLQPKRLAVFEACLIGLVAGLSAVLLKQGVAWLGGWRIAISHQLPALLVIPIFGLLFGVLAGFFVERFAPESSDSRRFAR